MLKGTETRTSTSHLNSHLTGVPIRQKAALNLHGPKSLFPLEYSGIQVDAMEHINWFVGSR